MATIYVDGKPHVVAEGQNLLAACLGLGYRLPFFCWHPALHAVGACRQCAVKQFRDERDRRGRLVMACMTPVADGLRISVDDPEARAFRAGIIEMLMANHPHDCPVCDEGGECHLQDMTVMSGHETRRYRFPKRTHRNQDLGPFVHHEMNRCIQCARCLRFYRDLAGGRDLGVFSAHHHVYFGRAADGPLESEFSGNLVEVCPTGVFTDKIFRRQAVRKWDLQTAPSVCILCGLGCNTLPAEQNGRLRRVSARLNPQVNGHFLCDRGRFGHGFNRPEERLLRPASRGRELTAAEWPELLRELLASARGLAAVGSPRAGLEANYLLRELVGRHRFFAGASAGEHELAVRALETAGNGSAATASIADAAAADAVLLMGEDVTRTAPLLALALRRAARNGPELSAAVRLGIPAWNTAALRTATLGDPGRLTVCTPLPTRLDDAAARSWRYAPADLVRFACAVAHAVDDALPPVAGLDEGSAARAAEVAAELSAAERPLLVTGCGCGSADLMQAAAAVADALCRRGRAARLHLVLPAADSMGLAMLGAHPLGRCLEEVDAGRVDTLVVLETELDRLLPAADLARLVPDHLRLVVIGHEPGWTGARADLVLPAATVFEATGTLVSSEGRAQRFFQVMPAPEGVRDPVAWLREAWRLAGRPPRPAWDDGDSLRREMAAAEPRLAGVVQAAPPASFRATGMKVPRQSPRSSGRACRHAHRSVHEPRPTDDPESPFAFSMEGYPGTPPPALRARAWAPGWNSVQAEETRPPDGGEGWGSRLLQPGSGKTPPPLPPPPDAPPDGRLLVVAAPRLFGSEPLSMRSRDVEPLVPAATVAVSADDALRLGLVDGGAAELELAGVTYRVVVRLLDPGAVAGLAGLFVPAHQPGAPSLPGWGRLTPGGTA